MEIRYVVTNDCNAGCYFCLNEYIGSKSTEVTMTPENFSNISQVARKLGVDQCTISGGEPTLRPDLEKIVKKVASAGFKPTIVSNGYLLTDHLNAYGLIDELHVSFHSFDEKEWERITKVKNGPAVVRANLIEVRRYHPQLKLRLNVVADDKNCTRESISNYIELAREIGANVSVFQNGYLRLLKELGRLTDSEEPSDFWNLDSFGGKLVAQTERKKTYDFGGARINLALLSSEMSDGESCWITPRGEGFADIRKRSLLIDFNPSLQLGDLNRVEQSLNSLFTEARIVREAEIAKIDINSHPEYQKLVQNREKHLDTKPNPYFF
jgi:wyosine [tRNA(Phe)-imidazoG37] synthetase (radical SAM superfamily)